MQLLLWQAVRIVWHYPFLLHFGVSLTPGRLSQHHITPGGGLSSSAAVAWAAPPAAPQPRAVFRCCHLGRDKDAARARERQQEGPRLLRGGMQPSIAVSSREGERWALGVPQGSRRSGALRRLLSREDSLASRLLTGGAPGGGRFGPALGITEQSCKLRDLSWITRWMMPVGAQYFFLYIPHFFLFLFASFPPSYLCLVRLFIASLDGLSK